ncbi:hypothetical protein B0H66DRAFT_585127 [Apodospora peruviana]|uniref:Uncharacterized protein n=1 Tax=Apodospora peruviana TaxID=516989 RepID=A0AAE0LYL2_9PEZI|nr:hypothetical protein B0H66DRAFT_585127 [Apodospora peruviana]
MDSQDMPAVVKKLRSLAIAGHNARITPDRVLDTERQNILIRAINNLLSTSNAILTFAQIIDDLPTSDVGFDRRSCHMADDHPLDSHKDLCPGSLAEARELCLQWKPENIEFSPSLLLAFQYSLPGTKTFEIRLVELVAVSIHQFGALLYQLDFRLHKGDIDAVVNYKSPLPDWYTGPVIHDPLPPTTFYHGLYGEDDIYPEGAADMVGYWAEDRILGGVGITRRINQLRDEQQRAVVDFLLRSDKEGYAKKKQQQLESEQGLDTAVPLPTLVDDMNRVSITGRGIYRDIWERKPATSSEIHHAARRPKDEVDCPEIIGDLVHAQLVLGQPVAGLRIER